MGSVGTDDGEESKFVPMSWQDKARKANSKHLDDAIHHFMKALDLNEKAIESRYHLALVLKKSDQLADAIKQLTKVIEVKS